MGRETWKRIDMHLYVAELSSCTPYTNTTLDINSVPIYNQNEIAQKAKRGGGKHEKCCLLVAIFHNDNVESCADGHLIFRRPTGL